MDNNNVGVFDPMAWANLNNNTTEAVQPQASTSSSVVVHASVSANGADLETQVRDLTAIIVQRGIDITSGYSNWLNLGFALADGLGENGRAYYHDLSSMNGDYNVAECDKQYNSCLRSHGQGVTIKTFFQMAKDAGVDLSQFAREHMHAAVPCLTSGNAQTFHNEITEKSVTPTISIDGLTPELEAKLLSCIINKNGGYPENSFLFSVDGVPVISEGDIHTLGAKQKGGKTSLIKIMLAASISGQWNRLICNTPGMPVLYIDTEMKQRDTYDVGMQSAKMAGISSIAENINFVNFRPLTAEEMKTGICYFIMRYQPKLVFIDGIVDLCSNFNDVEASQKLVLEFLVKLAEMYKCTIICVLHTNKTDNYTELRGHLGAFLEHKGSTVVKCEKDDANNLVTVKFATHRYAPVPEFHFTYDEDGTPICADQQHQQIEADRKLAEEAKKEAKKQQIYTERKNTVMNILRANGGSMERASLIEKVKTSINKGDSTVKDLIKQMMEEPNTAVQQNDKMISLSE